MILWPWIDFTVVKFKLMAWARNFNVNAASQKKNPQEITRFELMNKSWSKQQQSNKEIIAACEERFKMELISKRNI